MSDFDDVSDDVMTAYSAKLVRLMTEYANKPGGGPAPVMYATLMTVVGNLAHQGMPKDKLLESVAELYDRGMSSRVVGGKLELADEDDEDEDPQETIHDEVGTRTLH